MKTTTPAIQPRIISPNITALDATPKSMKKLFLLLILLAGMSQAQVTVAPFVSPAVQFFDNSGLPLNGGKVCTFAANSTTPLATYSDNGSTLNQNPVVLDTAGRATIYLQNASYKIVIAASTANSSCVPAIKTQDNVSWANLASTVNSLISNGTVQMIPATAATSGANQTGPNTQFCGNYWTGSASAADCWTLADVLGTGSNPTTTLTLSHSGSSGAATFSVPGNETVGGTLGVTGLSTQGDTVANKVQIANSTTSIPTAYAALPSDGGKVVLSSDITISSAQTVAITNGKPLFLDLNGRVITCTNTTGACLTITKVDNDVRYQAVVTNGTITYSGVSTNITGLVLGGVGLPFTNALIENLTIQHFNTAGSIGLDEFFNEEVSHNVVNFNDNNIGLQTELNTINNQYSNVYWQKNNINFKLIDSQSLSFIDCLPQSASNVRANQILAVTTNVANIRFNSCWFENNGDTTTNSRQLYVQAAAGKAITRIEVTHGHFNQGANSPAGGTIFEFAGPGTTAFWTIKNNTYNITNIQTGLTAGIGISVENDNFPNFDVALNSGASGQQWGLWFNPVGAAKKFWIYGGYPAQFDGFLVFNDATAAVNILHYNSNLWTFDRGAFGLTESTAPSGAASNDVCYGDSTLHGVECSNNNGGFTPIGSRAILTADWTCGTGGTVASCTAATIIGSGGGVPWTFNLPLIANSLQLDCDGVVGQATAATLNQWNLLTATNGATNVTASYTMATAATAMAVGAVTDQASTTTTFQIAPSWTLGGTGTKMPFHIHAAVEGASASGTVLSVQLLAPTVGDLVTIYRGSGCWIHP